MGITSHPFRHLVFVRPTAPLAANTTFEILTRIPMVPCMQEPCVAATYSIAAVFTTGSGADTVAPSFGGLSSSTSAVQTCAGSFCCGPYRAILYGFQSSTPTDDVGVAGLNLYRVGSGLVSELTQLNGFELCGGPPTGSGPPGAYIAPAGTFYAHAVDLAGNEDSNMQLVTVAATCADTVDGGTPPPDAGPAAALDAAAAGATPPGAGCGCAVVRRGDSPLSFLLLALLAAGRRRKRRRK